MALDTLIRKGVQIANRLTADLQVSVVHKRWSGQDTTTAPTFDHGGDPVTRLAIVERKQRLIRTKDGQEVLSRSVITFLTPFTALTPTVTERNDPIDERDIFVLPDGTSGPILDIVGPPIDPTTNKQYFAEVYLG